MKRNYVWIVEMREVMGRWNPCAAAAITYDEAHDERAKWEKENPSDTFRLVKYLSTRDR